MRKPTARTNESRITAINRAEFSELPDSRLVIRTLDARVIHSESENERSPVAVGGSVCVANCAELRC